MLNADMGEWNAWRCWWAWKGRHDYVIISMFWWPRTSGAVITLPSGLYSVSPYLCICIAHWAIVPRRGPCIVPRSWRLDTSGPRHQCNCCRDTAIMGATLATAGANEPSTYCTAKQSPAPVQASSRFIVLISPSSSSEPRPGEQEHAPAALEAEILSPALRMRRMRRCCVFSH